MPKITLTRVTSGYSTQTALNDNAQTLEDAIDNTLSRDGTSPNTMSADIDLNGNDLLNVGTLNLQSGGDLAGVEDITYENLDTNGDVGFSAGQVPPGDDVYDQATIDAALATKAAAADLTTHLTDAAAHTTEFAAKADAGANSDITSLSGLSTALSVSQGGTGATSEQAAINALSQSSGATSGYVLTRDGSGDAVWLENPGVTGGEINTASSLGGDADVYKTKDTFNLEFRGLTGTNGILLTENASDIEIGLDKTIDVMTSFQDNTNATTVYSAVDFPNEPFALDAASLYIFEVELYMSADMASGTFTNARVRYDYSGETVYGYSGSSSQVARAAIESTSTEQTSLQLGTSYDEAAVESRVTGSWRISTYRAIGSIITRTAGNLSINVAPVFSGSLNSLRIFPGSRVTLTKVSGYTIPETTITFDLDNSDYIGYGATYALRGNFVSGWTFGTNSLAGISFDPSQHTLPADVNILSATLKFNTAVTTDDTAEDLEFWGCLDNRTTEWAQGGGNAPSGTTTRTAVMTENVDTGSTEEVDVTDIIQAIVDQGGYTADTTWICIGFEGTAGDTSESSFYNDSGPLSGTDIQLEISYENE